MTSSARNLLLVTLNYWAFTITDGAIRMLVVLYFHQLGYSPLDIAFLFLFYEFFGIVTNLFGGWLSARLGLNTTMYMGMGLQVVALGLLGAPEAWLTVPFVMGVQALSGIAKDLNKMSAKASVKVFSKDGDAALFRWVAMLTGSKNALKGFGFFVGGALLAWVGFQHAVQALAGMLLVVLIATMSLLPRGMGKLKNKPKFTQIFSKTPEINTLSLARFFLFGSRDVWFVVALPVFMVSTLGLSDTFVGSFNALWVIGYGAVQAAAPKLLRRQHEGSGPDGVTARILVFALALLPLGIALLMHETSSQKIVLLCGLMIFGFVFALNSSVHSFLILAYSDNDKVAMNVGFYYMANAAGRLVGTVLSGWLFLSWGLMACLYSSSLMLFLSGLTCFRLPGSSRELETSR